MEDVKTILPKFDSIIFDLDGTIWDCSAVVARSLTLVCKEEGSSLQVSSKLIREVAGLPINECERIVLNYVEPHLRVRVAQRLSGFVPFTIEQRGDLALYDGVRDGLTTLSKVFELFVVSNCGITYLDSFLKYSTVGHLFKDVECYGRTLESKDKNIVSVIRRNNLKNPCYVGDTDLDQDAAGKANIPFFHVRYGFGQVTSAEKHFDTFGELVADFAGI